MVFLNLQIDSIIDALNTAGYIPSSLLAGGATTATVEVSAIEPTSPTAGDLWFSTSMNVLTIYNGIAWQEVSLSTEEKTQLASLSTYVSQAQAAELGAIDARDTILGMVAATGDAGSLVTWNPTTGVLTIPRGDTGVDGQSVDHISRTAGIGAEGTTDIYTVWGDLAETINLGTFTVYNGANGLVTSVAGRTGDVVLAEADITDLDKYTQAEVDGLLADKSDTTHDHSGVYEPADADIVKAPLGVLPALDGSNLTGIAGRTGDVVLTKSDVGLDLVDNTSDLAKPVSTATQNALNLKADKDQTITTTTVYTDNTTATTYKIYVDNGNITMEEL